MIIAAITVAIPVAISSGKGMISQPIFPSVDAESIILKRLPVIIYAAIDRATVTPKYVGKFLFFR